MLAAKIHQGPSQRGAETEKINEQQKENHMWVQSALK